MTDTTTRTAPSPPEPNRRYTTKHVQQLAQAHADLLRLRDQTTFNARIYPSLVVACEELRRAHDECKRGLWREINRSQRAYLARRAADEEAVR